MKLRAAKAAKAPAKERKIIFFYKYQKHQFQHRLLFFAFLFFWIIYFQKLKSTLSSGAKLSLTKHLSRYSLQSFYHKKR
jgi:hypothetical protein